MTEAARREQMKALFDREFPDFTGEMPYWRNQYAQYGYDDDAMLVTPELYEKLLHMYEGDFESEDYADLECDDVSPDMVGKKWLVVVDYHR
jgi:hypothetical protein